LYGVPVKTGLSIEEKKTREFQGKNQNRKSDETRKRSAKESYKTPPSF
jgi:hypothetical protein